MLIIRAAAPATASWRKPGPTCLRPRQLKNGSRLSPGRRVRGDFRSMSSGVRRSHPAKLRLEAGMGRAMQKWRIGGVTVTKIVELEVTGGSRFILPQATYDEILPIGWLQPHFADERGRLKMSIHALIVETPERRILVDTCLGNDKQGRRIPTWNNLQGPFLADLAAAGYPRDSIDTVLCTHLHVDHVGWNTMLVDRTSWTKTWVPTFSRSWCRMRRLEHLQ